MITGKFLPEARRAALVEDTERGLPAAIEPHPWQTDTCIGHWHYDRALLRAQRLQERGAVGDP